MVIDGKVARYDHRVIDGKGGRHVSRAHQGIARRPGAAGTGSLMFKPGRGKTMWKMLLSGGVVLAMNGASFGQTPSDGTRQVVGLFTSTCLSFADDPKALRDFMRQHHVPELNEQGRAIFLRGHVGVGFDATNKVTRLALVSEDNGVCSAFVDHANASEIGSVLAAATKARGFHLVQTSGKEAAGASSLYEMKVKDHLYKLVVSSNPVPNASVQAAITLAP